jgi:hypothetical protein
LSQNPLFCEITTLLCPRWQYSQLDDSDCPSFVPPLALTRVVSKLLFGIAASDPTTFLAVAALLLVVASAASYVPARRAMRIDPILALREE